MLNFLPRSLIKIILIGFVLLFAVRIVPGQSYWVKITNKTDHYIHVLINDRSFLYIAPDDYIRASFAVRELEVKVIYSPAQSVSGQVERDLYAGGEGQTSCERNVICNTVPAPNVSWEVTAEDLQGAGDS